MYYTDEEPLKLFFRTETLPNMDDHQATKVYNPEVQIQNFPLELIKRLPRLNEYNQLFYFLVQLCFTLNWVFLITFWLIFVHLSVSLFVYHFFLEYKFFTKLPGPISVILCTNQYWSKGIQVSKNEEPRPLYINFN